MNGQARLVLATGNPHKVEELAAIVRATGLALEVRSARSLGPAPEIAEDQGSFVAHALVKALGIAAWLRGRGEPGSTLVLADDSGLCVDALDASRQFASDTVPLSLRRSPRFVVLSSNRTPPPETAAPEESFALPAAPERRRVPAVTPKVPVKELSAISSSVPAPNSLPGVQSTALPTP